MPKGFNRLTDIKLEYTLDQALIIVTGELRFYCRDHCFEYGSGGSGTHISGAWAHMSPRLISTAF
jgi:hypothetical protein